MKLQIKRVYEEPAKTDGFRILVDRIWPRGMKKEKAAIDLWLKEIAPSNELRKWFDHDPQKWKEFRERYRKELKDHTEATDQVRQQLKKGNVTLVYSAKDENHNQAVVVKEYLS